MLKTASGCLLRPALSFLAIILLVSTLHAGVPTDSDKRAAIIGQLIRLSVVPEKIEIDGPRGYQQLVVTGHYENGLVRDLTHLADYLLGPDGASITSTGLVLPMSDGSGTLTVSAGGKSATVPFIISGMETGSNISFRNDVVAALNVGGCNAGACHGTPTGKNGFKLSLRGYDPADDHIQLTRDVLGRRVSAHNPMQSLLMQKALGRVPHEGGQRFGAQSLQAKVLLDWIASGVKDDPADLPKLQSIQVLPGDRVQQHPARWQQLAVRAKFSDGSIRDVTQFTVFTSSDTSVADVDRNGFVEFSRPGESAILARYLEQLVTVRLMYLKPKENFAWPSPAENNYIDKHVFAKLKMLDIPPSEVCTDQEFLRRAYMDVCGILPTSEEAKIFLACDDPNKREKLIDGLLARPEYADFWTLKWSDVLRSSRKNVQFIGIFKFREWMKRNLALNRPFDEVVEELLTSQGNTFSNPAANYYRVARDPQNLAETTAQLFFGVRMQCCKCHNHPFERWTQDDYYSLAAFFARVRQKVDPEAPGDGDNNALTGHPGAERIYIDRSGEVTQPTTNQVIPPKYLGGEVPTIPDGRDRRTFLAEWMTSPENPFFARATVNRIWYHLLGRGIVDPVDDFRDSNPASNEPLLDALARDFVAQGFDMKHLMKAILLSRTYQLSAQTNDHNKDDEKYFSHAVTRQHSAEILLDAICKATGMPEKFPGLPLGTRATQLPDGEINHVFLKTFGQPARELACECERENDSNLAQALQLINGPTIHNKLRDGNNRISKLLAEKKSDKEILDSLYLATLSRLPTQEETDAVFAHLNKNADKRRGWEDAQWVLMNSKEFLFRH